MIITNTIMPDVGDECRVQCYDHEDTYREENETLIDVLFTRETIGSALTLTLSPENAKRLMMALASVLGYGAKKEKSPKRAHFTLE